MEYYKYNKRKETEISLVYSFFFRKIETLVVQNLQSVLEKN